MLNSISQLIKPQIPPMTTTPSHTEVTLVTAQLMLAVIRADGHTSKVRKYPEFT